jgi:hypothetical protein
MFNVKLKIERRIKKNAKKFNCGCLTYFVDPFKRYFGKNKFIFVVIVNLVNGNFVTWELRTRKLCNLGIL